MAGIVLGIAEVVLVRCDCVVICFIATCVAEFHKAMMLEDWGFAVLFRRLFVIARTASNRGFLGIVPVGMSSPSCGLCFVCM
jgi:hypothetical protein